MPRIAEESIQRVAEACDIVELIGSYFPLKRAGTSFRTLCPFHKEKSPSFHVNPVRQSFHCFGCGAGGNVFRFVMDYEHVDFPSAVRRLAQRAGIVLEEEDDPHEQSRRDQRSRLLELHKEAAYWFHQNLLRTHEADHARAYLRKRGLTKEISVSWQLGYAPAGWEILRDWALAKGFNREELIQSGLVAVREGDHSGGYDRFRDRLMFPIRNDYGEVVAFSGRILNDSDREAKYVNSPETPIFSKGRVLFGLDKSKRALIDAGQAVVLEGQIDLISAFEHGVKHVVAPQGTAFTMEQARLLRRFVEQVILCFDSDVAGQNAVEKSLPALLSAGVEVRVARLPKGEDPDSMIRTYGVAAFQEQIAAAKDFFDHTIEKGIEDSAGNFGPRERADVARKLGGYLTLLPEAALRETTTAHVSSRLGLSKEALLEAGQKNPIALRESEIPSEITQSKNPPKKVSASTELICRLSLLSPEVRTWLMAQNLGFLRELDPELAILDEIIPALEGLEYPSPSTLLHRIAPELQPLISGWDLERNSPDPLAAVQDSVRGLRLNILKKKQSSLTIELSKPNIPTQKVVALQKEILDLQAMINDLSAPVT